MRTRRTALLAALVFASASVLASSFPTARAGEIEAVAVRDGKAVMLAASGRVTRTLAADGTVGRAAIAPDGRLVAMTVGRAVAGGPEGVTGDVVVAESLTGATVLRTRFDDPHLGGIAWGPGDRVAFVKDWYELWLIEVATGRARKLADGRAFGASASGVPVSGAGGLLFDPAFAPDGSAVTVGRVEETFHGEDDALDDLWTVDLAGRATRLTSLRRPAGRDAWRIVRSPVPLKDGRTLFTLASSARRDGAWELAAVTGGAPDGGAVEPLGAIRPDTYLAAVRDGYAYSLAMDLRTGTFELVRTSGGGQRDILARGISSFDVPDASPATVVEGRPDAAGDLIGRLAGLLGRRAAAPAGGE